MKIRPLGISHESWTDKKSGEFRHTYTLVIQDGEKLVGFQLRDPDVKPLAGIDVEVDMSTAFAVRRPYNANS